MKIDPMIRAKYYSYLNTRTQRSILHSMGIGFTELRGEMLFPDNPDEGRIDSSYYGRTNDGPDSIDQSIRRDDTCWTNQHHLRNDETGMLEMFDDE